MTREHKALRGTQSMASPRSRLVIWYYTHLICFSGRRFWRPAPGPGPCGDPRSPPRRGSPPFRGSIPLLVRGQISPARCRPGQLRPRTPLARGRDTEPRVTGGGGARRVVPRAAGGPVAAVPGGLRKFSFTGSNGCRYCSRVTNGSYVMSGPLHAEPLRPISGFWRRRAAGSRDRCYAWGWCQRLRWPRGWVPGRRRPGRPWPGHRPAGLPAAAAPRLGFKGSFPVPHFGDWMQDGHPAWRSQQAIASAVAVSQSRATAKPRSANPAPPSFPS